MFRRAQYKPALCLAFTAFFLLQARSSSQLVREAADPQTGKNSAAADARRLADIRYRGGATSYLEVLDSDTRMFSAELGVTQAELNELLSLVQIYRALGGGWQ